MKSRIRTTIVIATLLVIAFAATGFSQWGFGYRRVCSMFSMPGGGPAGPPVLDNGLGARQVRQICDMHRHPMVPVYTQQGINNALAFVGGPEGKCIIYDPDMLNRIFQQYGPDASLAILAHECGHIITGINVPGNVADWSDEMRADHFAGWTLARMGKGRRAIQQWLSVEGWRPDHRHPGGRTRVQVVEQGYIQGGGHPFGN